MRGGRQCHPGDGRANVRHDHPHTAGNCVRPRASVLPVSATWLRGSLAACAAVTAADTLQGQALPEGSNGHSCQGVCHLVYLTCISHPHCFVCVGPIVCLRCKFTPVAPCSAVAVRGLEVGTGFTVPGHASWVAKLAKCFNLCFYRSG